MTKQTTNEIELTFEDLQIVSFALMIAMKNDEDKFFVNKYKELHNKIFDMRVKNFNPVINEVWKWMKEDKN